MAVGFDPVGFGPVGFPGQGAASSGSGGAVQPAWFLDDDEGAGMLFKNTAGQRVGCQMVAAADGAAFSGSVSVLVTIDGGTQAAGSVGSGACTNEGNGYYTYAPAQAETNGDHVAFTFIGTGAVPRSKDYYTRAGDSFNRLGAPAGASIAADLSVIAAYVDSLETRLTATRAGYLDNLSAGAVAQQATLGTPAAASIAADLATIDTVVDTLAARLTAALSAKLIAHAAGVLTCAVGSGSTTTTVVLSTVEGATPSAVDDFYNGAVLVFTSGALSGQRTSITDYNGTTKVATVVALTGAPANGVTGVIV